MTTVLRKTKLHISKEVPGKEGLYRNLGYVEISLPVADADLVSAWLVAQYPESEGYKTYELLAECEPDIVVED